MQRPYLLASTRNAVATIAVSSLRQHAHAPSLKITDPAVRALTDFQHEPPLTVTEDAALEQVLDEMFRLGVRAFLVVREHVVTGLITAEHAERAKRGGARGAGLDGAGAPRELRVADVMTPVGNVPAVDWQTIEEALVRDLVEIFEGSGAVHLVVLENETAGRSSVRGLIHRARLERQLGSHWAARSVTQKPVIND
ncbi:MAG TPA: CBS domain-containing protein [Steroidobacteraceae bacterium]|nr:CBS domain-containing protein [Steroidobacteraceae bacterium]